jgi:hypothetical protein
LHANAFCDSRLGQKLCSLLQSGELATAAATVTSFFFAAGDAHLGQDKLVLLQTTGDLDCVALSPALYRELGFAISDHQMLPLVGGNGDPGLSRTDRCNFRFGACTCTHRCVAPEWAVCGHQLKC